MFEVDRCRDRRHSLFVFVKDLTSEIAAHIEANIVLGPVDAVFSELPRVDATVAKAALKSCVVAICYSLVL